MSINWAELINSATTGAASIIAASKGNVTKKETQLTLGTNSTVGVGYAGGVNTSALIPLVVFGTVIYLAVSLFRRKRG